MASDMVSKKGLIKRNSASLSFKSGKEEEMKKYCSRHSDGGIANHPLENHFGEPYWATTGY
ncbi:MAG TPA: hypothetical protein VK622_13355 [Puia sp.]|nr:hypothetical protein [Puia sp.]